MENSLKKRGGMKKKKEMARPNGATNREAWGLVRCLVTFESTGESLPTAANNQAPLDQQVVVKSSCAQHSVSKFERKMGVFVTDLGSYLVDWYNVRKSENNLKTFDMAQLMDNHLNLDSHLSFLTVRESRNTPSTIQVHNLCQKG